MDLWINKGKPTVFENIMLDVHSVNNYLHKRGYIYI
jgi:hypothetical protein